MQPNYVRPTNQPTRSPLRQPSKQPNRFPSSQPVKVPSLQPSLQPRRSPTKQPLQKPSKAPSSQPTLSPSRQPTKQPNFSLPTNRPTLQPRIIPSKQPLRNPTTQPFHKPSLVPTVHTPTAQPSLSPNSIPSTQPSYLPLMTPTVVPSIFPSMYPTEQPYLFSPSCQPSVIPLGRPSKTPILLPSSQPTSSPANRPSSQPRSKPTMRPSHRISHSPSVQPIELPTSQPSFQPKLKPSRQPSRKPLIKFPTKQPFRSPSNQPSTNPSQPSRRPSGQPSRAPKLAPSAQPIKKPSKQPYDRPSSQPSAQPAHCNPTSQPYSRPSNHPTSQPRKVPSKIPSSQPSKRPRNRPTLQPSFQPKLHPSISPSTQPNKHPSKQPTRQPSGKPSSTFPTSKPTGTPSRHPVTSKPTSHAKSAHFPTSSPTVEINYKTSVSYLKYSDKYKTLSKKGNDSQLFGTFFYERTVLEGTCNRWLSYVSTNLQLPFDNIQFYSLYLYSSVQSLTSNRGINQTATCSDINAVGLILQNLVRGISADVTCGQNVWKTFLCDGSVSLCINCVKTCSTTSTSSLCQKLSANLIPPILNPCFMAKCRSDLSLVSSSLFSASYKTIVLYPQFASPLQVTQTSNGTSLRVTVGLTRSGYLYCGAFYAKNLPQSTVDILIQGVSTQISANYGSVNNTFVAVLVVPGLNPSTSYKVVCMTKDYLDHSMPISEALTSSTTSMTACCKQVVSISPPSSIALAASSSSAIIQPQFSFSVNFVPQQQLLLSISLSKLQLCSQTNSTVPSTGLDFSPKSVTISALSPSSIFNVLVLGAASSSDCYLLRISTNDNSVLPQAVRFYVSVPEPGTLSQPSVPKLLSSIMNDDGTSVNVNFDSATNQAATVSTFNCDTIFSFTSSSSSACVWASTSVVTIRFQFMSSKLISVGDSITLRSGKIQALCVTVPTALCVKYTYATAATVTISPPKNPVQPIADISAASTVSICAGLSLDPTNSVGAGGREWNKVQWNVTASVPQLNAEAAHIAQYLNTFYRDTTVLATVPSQLLNSSTTYYVSLYVRNFLLQSSVATVSIFVQSASSTSYLSVRMYGSSSLTFRWKSVTFFASTLLTSCDGAKQNSTSLTYVWTLYAGVTPVTDIVSISPDSRFFKIAPYSLLPSVMYSLRVVVSVKSDNLPIFASDIVNFPVGVSGIRAVINGGIAQKANSFDAITLDASPSFDIDYPQDFNLSYTWKCVVYSPSMYYGTLCNLKSTDLYESKLSLAPYLLSTGVYNISVIVTNSRLKSGQANVMLTITNNSIPLVQIVATSSKYNYAQNIILTGGILSAKPFVSAEWISPSFNSSILSKITLTKLKATKGFGLSTFQLAIAANSLISGASYVFQLKASYAQSSYLGIAQVQVNCNLPPISGRLSVKPSSGVALDTRFFVLTSYWTDDSSDLPLTYTFGYYTLSPTDMNVLKGADQVTSVTSYLGQGLYSQGYKVTCVCIATDIYGVNANVTSLVIVSPSIISASTISLVNNGIASALSQKNPDVVNQLVAAAVGSLNSVDCSAVPYSCDAINRKVCAATRNTCGPCLPGFIGPSGDSNVACLSLIAASRTGEACASNSTCVSGFCSFIRRSVPRGICAETSKTCPNNCGKNGNCRYYDQNGVQQPACSIYSAGCSASCVCKRGFYGSDCAMSKTQLSQAQTYRESLCVGLYQSYFIQQVTAETVTSRASTVRNILSDMDQVTIAALSNCTAALVNTILIFSNPSLLCQSPSQTLGIMLALSNIVEFKTVELPSLLYNNVDAAIAKVSESCLDAMAVGQAPLVLTTGNIRIVNSLIDPTNPSSSACLSAQTDIEKFGNAPYTGLCPNFTANQNSLVAAIGLSTVSYTNNPARHPSNASNLIYRDTVYTMVSSSSSSSRRLSAAPISEFLTVSKAVADYSNSIELTIVLQNAHEIKYAMASYTNISIQCTRLSSKPYYTSGSCPSGVIYNTTCPAMKRGSMVVSCPSFSTQPVCTMWSGSHYSSAKNCQVVAFTSLSTTCKCRSYATASTNISEKEISSTVLQTNVGGAETFYAYATASIDSRDNVIVSTVSVFAAVLLAVVIGLMWVESEYSATSKAGSKYLDKSYLTKRTVSSFFDTLMPLELTSPDRTALFLRRIALEHPLCRLFNIFSVGLSKESPPTFILDESAWYLHGIVIMGKVMLMILLVTVLIAFTYADDGTCESIHHVTIATCVNYSPLPAFFNVNPCGWDASNQYCYFQQPQLSILFVLNLSFIVVALCIPLHKILGLLSREVRSLLQSSSRTVIPLVSTFKHGHSRYDEFVDCQSFRSTLFRAAGLALAQRRIDSADPQKEVTDISNLALADLERLEINSQTENFVDRTSYKKICHGFSNIDEKIILQKVSYARQRTEVILKELSEESYSNSEREKYLVRQFLFENFPWHQRVFLQRYLMRCIEPRNSQSSYRHILGICSVALLVAIFAAIVYILLILIGKIGSRSTTLWLIVLFASMGTDIFLMQFLVVWVHWVIVLQSASSRLRHFIDRLRQRSRIMLMRCSGVVRSYSWLIQHLNPVCRAVRMSKSLRLLPLSRLLMACNDFDLISDHFTDVEHSSNIVSAVFSWLEYAGLLLIAILPSDVADVYIESISMMAVYVAFYVAHWLATVSPFLLLVYSVLLLAVPFLYYYGWQQQSIRQIVRDKQTSDKVPSRKTAKVLSGMGVSADDPSDPSDSKPASQRRLKGESIFSDLADYEEKVSEKKIAIFYNPVTPPKRGSSSFASIHESKDFELQSDLSDSDGISHSEEHVVENNEEVDDDRTNTILENYRSLIPTSISEEHPIVFTAKSQSVHSRVDMRSLKLGGDSFAFEEPSSFVDAPDIPTRPRLESQQSESDSRFSLSYITYDSRAVGTSKQLEAEHKESPSTMLASPLPRTRLLAATNAISNRSMKKYLPKNSTGAFIIDKLIDDDLDLIGATSHRPAVGQLPSVVHHLMTSSSSLRLDEIDSQLSVDNIPTKFEAKGSLTREPSTTPASPGLPAQLRISSLGLVTMDGTPFVATNATAVIPASVGPPMKGPLTTLGPAPVPVPASSNPERKLSKLQRTRVVAKQKPAAERLADSAKHRKEKNVALPSRVIKFKHRRYSGRVRQRETLQDMVGKIPTEIDVSQKEDGEGGRAGPGSARSASTDTRLKFRKASYSSSVVSDLKADAEGSSPSFPPLELLEEEEKDGGHTRSAGPGSGDALVDSKSVKNGPGSTIHNY